MKKYVFLSLNYRTCDETKKCIASIDHLTCRDGEKTAVIVDNASGDGSYERLKKEYQNRSDIHVILNERNDGFSKGNNFGYTYITEHLDPDFILMINSDIEIRQKDFLIKVSELYEKSKFSVLGPDVYAFRMNLHQSPIKKHIRDIEETRQEFEKEQILLELYRKQEKENLVRVKDSRKDRMMEFLIRSGRKLGIDRLNWKKLPYWKEHEDVMLHGSALIFSELYIKKYSVCLYPMPFYYGEEDLMYLKCMRNQDKLLYSPKIKVYHSAGASATNAKGGLKTVKREIFRYENLTATKELYMEAFADPHYFDVSMREEGKEVRYAQTDQ